MKPQKVNINSALLHDLFNKVSIFGRKHALPFSELIKVDFVDGICKVASSDGENFITYKMCIDDIEKVNLSFCISIQSGLIPFLKTLGNQSISLSIIDNVLKLYYNDKNVSTFPILDTSNFIEPKNDANGYSIQINPEDIKTFLYNGKFFTSSDTRKPIFQGIYLELKNNKLIATATNGAKLYTDSIDFVNNEEFSFIINQNAINAIIEMTNTVEDNTLLDFYICDNTTTITSKNCCIVCRNIEGKFPNFKALISNDNDAITKIRFVTSEFITLLNRMLIITKDTKPFIIININDGICKITCEDGEVNKKNEEIVECEIKGENIKICLDASYLLNIINTIHNNKFVMYIFSANKPIIIKEQGKNKILVLAPTMI